MIKGLILEDNAGDARLIIELIKEAGASEFEMKSVTTMKDALVMLEKEKFDILLTDLSLPDSHGLETYRKLRAENSRIPIVILSGNTDAQVSMKAVREGAQDYLIKGQNDGASLVRCMKYSIERKHFESELEQVRSQQQNNAKLASLGEMVGGVAHEINTPLGAILLTSQSLKSIIDNESLKEQKMVLEMIGLIEKTTNQIAKIVKSLRTFAKDSSNTPFIDTKLKAIVDNTTALCAEKFYHLGIQIKIDLESINNISLECRESEIIQVILNILNNSKDAISSLTDKWIQISCRDLDKFIEIKIQDSGSGISENIREKIFNPFFTTKDIGKGTGLGLSISKGIIDSHGGKISVDPSQKNTTFLIQLPKVQEFKRH